MTQICLAINKQDVPITVQSAFIRAIGVPNVSAMTTIPHSRRGSLLALFAAAAFMNAAMATASAVSTIVAADRIGPAWGGLPPTAGVAGTGFGAIVLSRAMSRYGRRAGLLAGYASALAGAVLAIAAVASARMPLLVLGMVLLGIGNAGAQLSRYAAADLYPPDRRGAAIGSLIWAGAIGGVGGPLLLMPAQRAAAGVGWSPITGPFALAALATLGALVASLAAPRGRHVVAARTSRAPVFRSASVRSAAATMVTAQVVMVAVMTAAPLSMHEHGRDLAAIGSMLSAHTLGMFALAPLSGRLVDRVGSRAVMVAGLATLAASAAFVATSPDGISLMAGLFLLGYGWNLSIVGGSGALAARPSGRVDDAGDGARAEGAVDALSWGTSTLATTASTLMFVHGGYAALATAAAILTALPLLSLGRQLPGVQREVPTGAVAVRPAEASLLISASVSANPVSDESSAVANTMPSTVPSGEISGPPELPLRTMARTE
jgi:MFS family permease